MVQDHSEVVEAEAVEVTHTLATLVTGNATVATSTLLGETIATNAGLLELLLNETLPIKALLHMWPPAKTSQSGKDIWDLPHLSIPNGMIVKKDFSQCGHFRRIPTLCSVRRCFRRRVLSSACLPHL